VEKCLPGEEAIALGDRGYGKKNRTIDEFQNECNLSILTPTKKPADGVLTEEQKAFNRMLLSVRPVVEHPFRVVKRQFGFVKVRYRALAKNTGQIVTLLCRLSVDGPQAIVALGGRGAPVKREIWGELLGFHGQGSKNACF